MEDDKIRVLEERIAWLQRHALEQDRAMFELGESLRKMEKQLASLLDRTRDAGGPAEGAAPIDERPPHY